jgi:hypothetical protein
MFINRAKMSVKGKQSLLPARRTSPPSVGTRSHFTLRDADDQGASRLPNKSRAFKAASTLLRTLSFWKTVDI